ncbi:hypothetical protein DSO57_1025335 [Entomophthora muscae]|uniref:Uncharacterized protein n=1 Tax=Entomophthora muscae TaxID=34485 RepID=A0ACC2SF90_9FUNG|nr:hypothetical protein DSO57_1025335 [Entomophthora muscae]
MSTLSHPSAVPPGQSPITVVTTCDSQAAFKFWDLQNVGTFSGKDAARLKEVRSKLCNDSCIWHQDMFFETWEEWKVESKKRFIGHKPDPQHLLRQVKISQFSALQSFIVKLQDLVGIPTFKNTLTPAYAGLIRKANPSTLEEAYNLMRKNYTIYVEREQDEDVKANSKWNPFTVEANKKEPYFVETLEAKIKEMQTRFEAIYLAHKHPSRVTGYRQVQHNYPFTGNCYN